MMSGDGHNITDRGYVSLDDLNDRSLAKNDPELFPYMKIYADSHHEPGAFWLTGSQVFRLMRGVQ